MEGWAPLQLQEPYDNSGLLLGDLNDEIQKVLITLDITEEVIDEAIQHHCNFIIAHHPLIFKGLKRIGRHHWIDKCIRKAIHHDIALYAIHTNLDNLHTGVNHKIAERLSLARTQVLEPKQGTLSKLTVFIPHAFTEQVLSAMHRAGAGEIGNYRECSFQLSGTGTFTPNEAAHPTIGTSNKKEYVDETRAELLVKDHLISPVIQAMIDAHPYEEVAYFLQKLENKNQEAGAGLIGELAVDMMPDVFLKFLKDRMLLPTIRHTRFMQPIRKVAICGGSGSFLLSRAKAMGANAFVTGDMKYHEFFEHDDRILIADIGHYESEIFTKELLKDKLQEKFTSFAFRLSKVNTNPINYF